VVRSNSVSGMMDSLTSSIVLILSISSSHTPFQQSPVSDWNVEHVGNNWLQSSGTLIKVEIKTSQFGF
jgi:hypothetical protein